jgi:hypothetical protein
VSGGPSGSSKYVDITLRASLAPGREKVVVKALQGV